MADDWEDETATDANEAELTASPPRNRACLTVLTGASAGTMFKLRAGRSLIGRANNAEARLVDDGISRNHAALRFDGHDLWLDDLGSRNGTYVNGTRITAATLLCDGDKIQIGRGTVVRFAFHDQLDESFHEQLVGSALRDPLTMLFNKRYLHDRLDSELKFARRHKTTVSLLMLDLDHFKAVNDGHGHLAGDAVLVNLAAVVLRTVRNEDVVARFGGEELAVILRNISVDDAALLGERLRKTIDQTATAIGSGAALRVTVSIGLAGYPSLDAETPEQLIEAADQALYRAKHAGRNRVAR